MMERFDDKNRGRLSITDGMNKFERGIKRAMDIVGAVIVMIILSPLFLFVYIALKCQSKDPVIFSQERIGYGGRPFTIYKFRTMNLKAEEEGVPLLAEVGDSRLTPVGRFLREHHLDELPQLWNVLIGDMSFVGPRPERKFFIEKIMQEDSRYVFLYKMRPGVTSEATLYNGYTDTMEKMLIRLNMDLHYLETRSLLIDVKIIFATFLNVFVGKKF